MITGYYSYQTHADGLCQFSTLKAAVRNATESSNREGHQVIVHSPAGLKFWVIGKDMPREHELTGEPL